METLIYLLYSHLPRLLMDPPPRDAERVEVRKVRAFSVGISGSVFLFFYFDSRQGGVGIRGAEEQGWEW